MTRKPREGDELGSGATIVERLGPHSASAVGLELDADRGGSDTDLGRWLVLCILLGGRTAESAARDAYRLLDEAGLAAPDAIASAGVTAVFTCLGESELKKTEVVAAVLFRVASNLASRHGGSVEQLAGGADDLEDLARRLASLGSGFGKAAVFRFLTPLRDRWSAAGDLPASPGVLHAGIDLGILSETHDEESAPGALAQWLARNESEGAHVPVRDLEAALDRLGRAACSRERTDRCLLREQCPRRN